MPSGDASRVPLLRESPALPPDEWRPVQVPIGGGLMTAVDAWEIPPGMAQSLENVEMLTRPDGTTTGFKMRNGYATYATVGGLPYIVGWVHEYPRTLGANRELLWSDWGGTLRYGTAGTVARSGFTANKMWAGISMRDPVDGLDKVYFCPGAQGLWVYWVNGANRYVKHLSTAGGADDLAPYNPNVSANPPEETNLLRDTAHDIQWADVISSHWGRITLGYRDTIYFSEIDVLSYFYQYQQLPSGHGDWINALRGGWGALFVGKEYSTWIIRGADFDSSDPIMVHGQLGCPSRFTPQYASELGGVIFQASDGQVYLVDQLGQRLRPLSKAIAGNLQVPGDITLPYGYSWLHDGRYWLAINVLSASHAVYSLDLTTLRWEHHPDYPRSASATVYAGLPLLGHEYAAQTTVWRVDTGTTDNGAAINGLYRSHAVAPAGLAALHHFGTLWITARGSGNLTVTPYVDGVAGTAGVKALQATDKVFRVDVNQLGHRLDIAFEGTAMTVTDAQLDWLLVDPGRAD